MSRAIAYTAALLIGAAILPFVNPSSVPFTLIAGIMIGIAVPLLDLIAANSRFLRLAYYSVRYARKSVRISASYMFRIKMDGTYLLIKGHRWPHYQPVGGVYKLSPSAKHMMDKIRALDDDLVPIDEASASDIRIRIPGRKLVAFARWFESGLSRETSSWREFHEELVRSGVLSGNDFPFIFDDFIRREIPKIRFSRFAQSMELFIADIYELRPTIGQIQALHALKKNGNPEIIWATEDQIRRLGTTPGQTQHLDISETAAWVL
jgi:hypothetical protein